MVLSKKLTQEEQEAILKPLFGLFFIEDVLHDEEGCEFYGMHVNDKHDLTTLQGIFNYQKFVSEEKGSRKKQLEIIKVLGL
jgi:hypothetical protein